MEVETDFEPGHVPTEVTLTIFYQQLSVTQKRIISAELELDDFVPAESSDGSYELHIEYAGLSFLDLLNLFELDISVYLVLYFVLLFIAIFYAFLLWLPTKIFSRRVQHSRIRFYFFVHFLSALLSNVWEKILLKRRILFEWDAFFKSCGHLYSELVVFFYFLFFVAA